METSAVYYFRKKLHLVWKRLCNATVKFQNIFEWVQEEGLPIALIVYGLVVDASFKLFNLAIHAFIKVLLYWEQASF